MSPEITLITKCDTNPLMSKRILHNQRARCGVTGPSA